MSKDDRTRVNFDSADFAEEINALNEFFDEIGMSALERYALMTIMCSYIRTDLKIQDEKIVKANSKPGEEFDS